MTYIYTLEMIKYLINIQKIIYKDLKLIEYTFNNVHKNGFNKENKPIFVRK